ncbi:gamma-glutamyltransferase family protein [Aurantiacibacter zhengii]|uniref:Gamma-glutamyltransferase family protein n=1 Tax=Aurantiacibacter zhengii TaxID=2307003 RepID=A0A418NSZ3_9SPHN|nr:gamma-glutamyltransferase family protein [Aurantiacibacter zhengii]RIV86518.1 gamma-glutamyltransferase family protein [Aurantiacibacter zhengii]
MSLIRLCAAAAALALASCTTVPGPAETAGTSFAEQSEVAPFVIAANPLAAEAGMALLENGGNAADAALAVQSMLSLVEPQSSGMGGGAFLNYYDAVTGEVIIYDGRETAPAQASRTMFLDTDGEPLGYREAVVSGRATGVPGAVAALAMLHDEHGALAWDGLFDDAIRTAEEGFVITPRLGRFLSRDFPQLSQPDAAAYFARPDGTRMQEGDRLRNPAYADFLRRLSANGISALYEGSTAAQIVQRTRAAPRGGTMTMADLANYRPIKREPVCNAWRVYRVCAPPPPSSGAAMLELLALLERTEIASLGPQDPRSWYLFAEASRLMYADRDAYFGDGDFVDVPVEGLLDPVYLDARAALIGPAAAENVEPGRPQGADLAMEDLTHEPAGTSHFIVRDRHGNVLSITTTVESIFGTGRMVDGFFLNNQLTDFAFNPLQPGGDEAPNAVAPGKRPRSSMVPLILLDADGRFAGAIGSAGGNSIPAYVGKTLVGAVDWGLPMQQALALPNLVARGNRIGGEVSAFDPAIVAGLAERGIDLEPGQGEDSGVHAVLIRDGRVDGGYDPRREGVVLVGEP